MEQKTKPTPAKPRRKLRKWMFWLLFPLVAWGGVEIADPFPNSLWFVRVLATKYLVHVRADLTVDGEALVLERTIRCFEPVDFKLWASREEEQPGLRSNGQAGDTLAATTSKGRLFALNVPDACGALGMRLRPGGESYIWTDPATHAIEPVRLSKDEIQAPVLYEIFGGRKATRIDAYIAPKLLRQGYHGVQLNEIVVEPGRGVPLKDWNGYDWFGRPNWTRTSFDDGRYSARYLWAVPEARWDEVFALWDVDEPPDRERRQKVVAYLARLRNATRDEAVVPPDLRPSIFHDVHTTWKNLNMYASPGGPPMRFRVLPDWIPESIVPCVRMDVPWSYACDPDKYGIQSFEPYPPKSTWTRNQNPNTYHFAGHTLVHAKEWPSDAAYYLSVEPRVLYSIGRAENVLVRR